MGVEHVVGDDPVIARPELTLPALRRAVAIVVPSRLEEFLDDLQRTFDDSGEGDSVLSIRTFYRHWSVIVEIERHPRTAARLHAAERDVNSPDDEISARAIREAGEIVRAAHRAVSAAFDGPDSAQNYAVPVWTDSGSVGSDAHSLREPSYTATFS